MHDQQTTRPTLTRDASSDGDAFEQWREDGTSERVERSGVPSGAIGINHMVMLVRDMEASHDFWTRVMRLEHSGTQGGPGRARFLRFYRSHPNTHHDLALSPCANPDDYPVPAGARGPSSPGLNHVAWTYPDIDMWRAQVAHVMTTGWPIEFRMEHGMSHSAYLKDPDGFIIELMFEFPEEYWLDNVDQAMQYRRFIEPHESDYIDPDRDDLPRFSEHGIVNRDPVGRPLPGGH